MSMPYTFTNHWFKVAEPIWNKLLQKYDPQKILEIGSYEGASACYMIDRFAAEKVIELHCIDTWHGGEEHKLGASFEVDMAMVQKRFKYNVSQSIQNAIHPPNVFVHQEESYKGLSKLIAMGHASSFDMVYVDGSHEACDVLLDAAMAMKLLKVGGLLIFDDYVWTGGAGEVVDVLDRPKLAIDAFVNINARKLKIINFPLYQFYVEKTSE